MKIVKYFEFNQSDLDAAKSFRVKDELNPKIWDDFKIDDEVREDLLKIAGDFYESTGLEAEVEDIVLTGSLANYNWSEKYSDYDLHILIDFKNVNDVVDLVKKYVDSAKSIWNKEHDIKIKGYEVEVYIQDVSEPHKSTGVFSLLNDKWNIKPEKFNFEPDEDMIAEKGKSVMMAVDELEEEVDEDKYEAFHEKLQKVWEKVKNYRKSGLESEGGELSMGNLVFKFLRRNGYISKIIELKRKSYDKQFK
jgi:DNA-binding Lrp family transcriptional regulator